MNPILRKLADLLTRVRLPREPISPSWLQLVGRQVPLIARLPTADQDRLYHIMQLFVKEVPFEGCGGLELREEIRVTIAAQACLLLLKMPSPVCSCVRRGQRLSGGVRAEGTSLAARGRIAGTAFSEAT